MRASLASSLIARYMMQVHRDTEGGGRGGRRGPTNLKPGILELHDDASDRHVRHRAGGLALSGMQGWGSRLQSPPSDAYLGPEGGGWHSW